MMGRKAVWWFFQVLMALLFRLFSKIPFLFFSIKVVGKEHTKGLVGPIIIAPNHKTYVDHFFILAVLPLWSRLIPARAMAADWLFKVPVVGWALKHLFGAFRAHKGEGLAVSLRGPLKYLEKGGVVGIYPEGGIRYRPGVHEVKIGVAYLAQKSGAPILPAAIKGIEYLTWKSFFFGRRKVEVVFGNPFLVDQAKDLKEVSQDIRLKIKELYDLS